MTLERAFTTMRHDRRRDMNHPMHSYCVNCGLRITLERWSECRGDPLCEACEDAYHRFRDEALINDAIWQQELESEGR